MNREQYKQLLVDKGYDEDVINGLLKQYDIKMGKITGATNVGANAAPDMTAPGTDLTSEISLSDYPSVAATVETEELVTRGDEFGTKDIVKKTISSDFYKELSKNLDEKVLNKYIKGKTKEEIQELDTDTVLDDVVNNIQSQYIANDPFIKAKRDQYTATIQPQLNALQNKYSKLARESTTSELAFENEAKLADLEKQYQEERSKLYEGFSDDVDVQKRLQAYMNVANKYSLDVARKIGRGKNEFFRFMDSNIGKNLDIVEGLEQGRTLVVQAFAGIDLQMQETSIRNTVNTLEHLKKQNPEDETSWITNIIPGDEGLRDSKVERQTGTVADAIKFYENKLKTNSEKLEKNLLPFIERQEKLLDYVQYLEDYCAALEGHEIDNAMDKEVEDEVMQQILDKHLSDEQKSRKDSIQESKNHNLHTLDDILDELKEDDEK